MYWKKNDRETERSSYLQFGGGSKVISANSFWILLADVERALDPKALELRSLALLSRSRSEAGVADELEEDIFLQIPINHSW